MSPRKRTRKEIKRILHRLSQRYKLRTLKIVHEDGNPKKHLYRCYEKPMKKVTISESCENCNQMKQRNSNVEDKYGNKYEPKHVLNNDDCIITKEEPEYPPDMLYVSPKPGTGERIRRYDLNSKTPPPGRSFFECTHKVFEKLLKMGLTWRKVKILPWIDEDDPDIVRGKLTYLPWLTERQNVIYKKECEQKERERKERGIPPIKYPKPKPGEMIPFY